MRVLLDENLPHDLRHFLPGHEVFTVGYLGWKGLENGALLARASLERFDVVVTMDVRIQYQHNQESLPLAVVVVRAPSNALDVIRPLVPALLDALDHLAPRSLVRVGG